MSPAEIVVANGAKQAIANAVLSLIEPGDEVILLSPYWVSYEISVRLAGGVPVVLQAGVEEDFKAPAAAHRGGDHASDQAAHPQLAQQPDGRGVDAGRARGDRRDRPRAIRG